MKRVMIVGQPGGGKSWLAREIGKRTGLPVVHMDLIHWKPGWVMRDEAERVAMATEVELSDAWVFEGGLSRTYAHRLSRADTLIVLDTPFLRRVWRVFTRTIRQIGHSRPDLPDNCPERFDAEFWMYIWRTRHSAREKNLALIDKAQGKRVYLLRSPADIRRFLHSLDVTRDLGQEAAHGEAAY